MKPPPFIYVKPATLTEAISALSKMEDPRILAGGQSLLAMLNLRYVFPGTLIDINGLQELVSIEASESLVRIGAMTRQRRIEMDADLARVAPIFRQALRLVGHRQTRNRGTIGGSICHLDPAAELAALLLLHDAAVEVAGPKGTRRVAADDFIVGYMTPGIELGEMVTAIEFRPWIPAHGFGFNEFARRHGDFAVASAAVLLEPGKAGTLGRAAICIGGVGSVPQRLAAAEAALAGSKGEPEAVVAALSACSELECIADFHGGTEYRLSVARAMLRKSIEDAITSIRRGEEVT